MFCVMDELKNNFDFFDFVNYEYDKLIQIAFGVSLELMQSNEQWFVCWCVLQVFPSALE